MLLKLIRQIPGEAHGKFGGAFSEARDNHRLDFVLFCGINQIPGLHVDIDIEIGFKQLYPSAQRAFQPVGRLGR